MKHVKRIVLVLIFVLIVGLGALYLYRNSLIRSAVETQANSSLGVKTTLGSANLAPFGGTLALGDLKIGSPAGYKADQMFTLGELGLGVNYSDLRKDPVRVSKITIDKPRAVLEMVDGKFNFQKLMDDLAARGGQTPGTGAPAPSPAPAPADQKKMIIDELVIKDAIVEVRAPLLPSAITVNIPLVTLKQIGNGDGAQNGAAIKDVVGAAMSALAASAANSGQLSQFGDLNKMLAGQAQAVMGKVQKELAQQVEGLTRNLTGEIGKVLPGGADVGKTLENVTGGKDPAKAVTEGLGGLLNTDKKKDEKKK